MGYVAFMQNVGTPCLNAFLHGHSCILLGEYAYAECALHTRIEVMQLHHNMYVCGVRLRVAETEH